MYEHYWKLTDKPFENDHVTEGFFFVTPMAKEALARLLYAVGERKRLAVLAGPDGSGKTYLLNALSRALAARSVPMQVVQHPVDHPLDFLRQVSLELGVASPEAWKSEVLFFLRQHLSDERARGRQQVLAIDEAHTITSEETWAQLRLLADMEEKGEPLLTVILAGEESLLERLHGTPGLAQRTDVLAGLRHLDEDEVKAYVVHRLTCTSGDAELFDTDALDRIAALSGGNPRLTNRLCDRALMMGFGSSATRIDPELIDKASDELAPLLATKG